MHFGSLIIGESDFGLQTLRVTNAGPGIVQIEGVEIIVGGAYFELTGNLNYPTQLLASEWFDVDITPKAYPAESYIVGILQIRTNETRLTHSVKLRARITGGNFNNPGLEIVRDDLLALIEQESWARVTADTAEAGLRLTLSAQLTGLISSEITEERIARVSGLSAEAIARTQLGASLTDSFEASILQESTTRANQFAAEAIVRQALEASLQDDYNALILIETSARVNAVSAVASDLMALEASFASENADTLALIEDETIARATAMAAEVSRVNSLLADITGTDGVIDTKVNARVLTEQTARATAIGAEAARVDGLLANYETGTSAQNRVNAAVNLETVARAAADTALAGRVSTLEASVISGGSGGVDTFARAAIVTEETARIAEDVILAQSVNTVSAKLTKVGGGNLLRNSSFEDRDVHRPYGYSLFSNMTPANFQLVARAGRESTNAFAIQSNAASGSEAWGLITGNTTDGIGGVTGGWRLNTTYMLTFWAKKEGPTTITGFGFDHYIGMIPVTAVTNPTLSANWQRYVFKLTTGGTLGSANGDFALFVIGCASGDVLIIDQIQIEEGEVATSWKYGPPLSSDVYDRALSQSLAATITSDRNARISGDQAQATAREALEANLQTQINGKATPAQIDAAIVSERTVTAGTVGTAVSAEAASRESMRANLQGQINGKTTDAAVSAAIVSERTVTAGSIGSAVTAEANSREAMRANLQGQINGKTTDAAVSAAIVNERSVTTGSINGAVSAEASQRQVLEARVNGFGPPSQNAVVDSDFAQGLKHFVGVGSTYAPSGPGFSVDRGVNLNADWSGMRNVFWARVNTGNGVVWPAGGHADVLWTPSTWGGVNSDNLANLKKYGLPLKNGDRVYYRALVGAHRCAIRLHLLLLDLNGNHLGNYSQEGGRNGGGGQGNPANFDLVGQTVVISGVPDAAYGVLMVRMLPNGGGDDPYLFLTEPDMGVLPASQTALPPYTSGRSDPSADKTSDNTANDTQRVGGQLSSTLLSRVTTTESAIAGVSAQWGVEVNVNGQVSGIKLLNGGGRSNFTVTADTFAVVNPAVGAEPVFEVTGGITRIRNAVIGTANVGTGNLALNSVSNIVATNSSLTTFLIYIDLWTNLTSLVLGSPSGSAVLVQADVSFQMGSAAGNISGRLIAVQNGVTTVIGLARTLGTAGSFLAIHTPSPGAATTYRLQFDGAPGGFPGEVTLQGTIAVSEFKR